MYHTDASMNGNTWGGCASRLNMNPLPVQPPLLTFIDRNDMTTYQPLHLLPLPLHPTDPKPAATSITVDPFSDLLWIGTSAGTVSALCSPLHCTPNVRFPAHGHLPIVNGSAVKSIRVTDREVWTLTEGGIGGRKRGGAAKWNVSDHTRSLRTMSPNPINSHEVLAGGSNGLIVANTSRGDIVKRVRPVYDDAKTRLTPLASYTSLHLAHPSSLRLYPDNSPSSTLG